MHLCHFVQSHIRKVYACLAVTCHLHFWKNDRGLLRATAVTRGWNGYRNKSQHRKLTLEKKILPPLQQGFEPATFRSRVRRSNHWAIPVYQGWDGVQSEVLMPQHTKKATNLAAAKTKISFVFQSCCVCVFFRCETAPVFPTTNLKLSLQRVHMQLFVQLLQCTFEATQHCSCVCSYYSVCLKPHNTTAAALELWRRC